MGKRSVEAATLHALPALGICFGDVGPRRIPRIEPVLCLEREVVPLATARWSTSRTSTCMQKQLCVASLIRNRESDPNCCRSRTAAQTQR